MRRRKNKGNNSRFAKVETLQMLASNNIVQLLATSMGISFFCAAFWSGAELAANLNSALFAFSVILGNLLICTMCITLTRITCRTRLSVEALIEFGFGTDGSYIASFILCVVHLGWLAISIGILASLLKILIPFVPIEILFIVIGITMSMIYFIKSKTFTFLSFFSLICYAALGIFCYNHCVKQYGSIEIFLDTFPNQEISVYWAVSVVIGSLCKESMVLPNVFKLERFGISMVMIFLIFIIANTLAFALGAIIGNTYQGYDLIQNLYLQGAIIIAFIAFSSNIFTSDNWSFNILANRIEAMIGREKVHKPYIIIATGVICVFLAGILYNNIFEWMFLISILVPAIGGILVADFYVIKKGQTGTHYHARKYKASGITAFLCGVGTATLLPGVAALNSFAIATIVYSAWMKFADKKN